MKTKRTPSGQLPAYLNDLHAIAERHGIKITLAVEQAKARIKWTADERALHAARIVTPSYHLPLTCARLHLCIGSDFYGDFHAMVRRTTSGFELEVEMELPDKIRQEKGVEVCVFPDRMVYYASADALVASGFCSADKLPSKRENSSRRRRDRGRHAWQSRWHQSGNVIHCRETEDGVAKRMAQEEEWRSYSDGTSAARETLYASPEAWLERIEGWLLARSGHACALRPPHHHEREGRRQGRRFHWA